ncbi:hypothetical protein J6590_041172 [Homalodisca vitripennis]|nr:hypothetical protein J6590_041172 [Homalodisca vitripennis]
MKELQLKVRNAERERALNECKEVNDAHTQTKCAPIKSYGPLSNTIPTILLRIQDMQNTITAMEGRLQTLIGNKNNLVDKAPKVSKNFKKKEGKKLKNKKTINKKITLP